LRVPINDWVDASISSSKADAIQFFEQVHQIQAKQLGLNHFRSLAALNNLAMAYRGVGRTTDAIRLHEQARDLRIKNWVWTTPTRWSRYATWPEPAWPQVSAPMPSRHLNARDERVTNLDTEFWNTWYTLNSLGTEYCLAGSYADAVTLHEPVLEVRLQMIGADLPHILPTRCDLAPSYGAAGRTDNAGRLLEQVRIVRLDNRRFDPP
jgi:hypothetical protein